MALFGVTPVGQYALGVIPASEDLSTPVPFWGFFDDNYADRIFVLCVAPLPLVAATDTFWYPLGQYPLGFLTNADKTVPDLKYYANKALVTGSDDVPPNKTIPARLINAINFRAAIPLPGSTSAGGSSSFGFVRIANPGDLDSEIMGASWAGRDAVIWIGGTMHPGRADEKILKFSEYEKLYSLQVADMSATDRAVDLSVRNPIYKLQKPIQQSTYTGSGDYEGGDDIKGQHKPVALGQCFKVPAVLVDDTEFIYQYHDGSGTTVDAAYDAGVAFAFQEDSTDLINLTVTTGNYATDVSRGLVKWSKNPSSEIVVDVTGVGGSTVSSILTYLADVAGVSYDSVAFNSFGQYNAGYWVDTSAINIDSVFTELMISCDGWFLFNRAGAIVIGEHTPVQLAEPVLTIDGRDTVDAEPEIVESSLRRAPGPPPVYRYTLGYKKYGAPSEFDSDQYYKALRKRYSSDWRKRRTHSGWRRYKLADEVTPDQTSDWAQEFRKVDPVESPTTLDYFLNAVSIEKDTHLTTESEVVQLATDMLTRDGKLRGLYSMKITRNLYKLFPGDVITVKHDRFNLSAGKKGRVISMTEDAATETTTLEVLINE